jgi:hypothetical protein
MVDQITLEEVDVLAVANLLADLLLCGCAVASEAEDDV